MGRVVYYIASRRRAPHKIEYFLQDTRATRIRFRAIKRRKTDFHTRHRRCHALPRRLHEY